MLIAVASKSGRSIDQHFGNAGRFLVYDVSEGEARLVEERKVPRYLTAETEGLRQNLLERIAQGLGGCRAVVCARIGAEPQKEMARRGLPIFPVEGPIRETLLELFRVLQNPEKR